MQFLRFYRQFFRKTMVVFALPTLIFLQDLRIGDSNPEVLELQKVLNSDPMTEVAVSGAGSIGHETEYFGPATADAVKRFQNKYADEVLRPAGLTQGSGFVGLWTRLKLNQILMEVPASVPANIPATEKLSEHEETSSTQPTLSAPPKHYGGAGERITLSGSGFSLKANTINFEKNKKIEYKIENVPAKNSGEISFVIPGTVKPGRYDVSVSVNSANILAKNSTKTSDTLPFMVTVPGAVLPTIEKIEPAEAKFGQNIKILGANFTSTDNIFTSNLGVIDGLKSSDGKTLNVTVPLPDYLSGNSSQIKKAWFGEKDNLYWPVRIRIVNVNGVSNDTTAAKFIINI